MARIQERIRASTALENKQYDEVISICTAIVENFGDDVESLRMMAQSHVWKADIDTAVSYANRALKLDSSNFDMLMLSARYWYKNRNGIKSFTSCVRRLNMPRWVCQCYLVGYWALPFFWPDFDDLRSLMQT